MQIEWDLKAVRDLEEIRAFIAADKPGAAVRVAERIKTAIGRLSEFPLMGRQTLLPGVRVLPVPATPYLVYYEVLSDRILIVAVFHGARRRFLV
jgi:toxin ParE1/3/4